MAAFGLIEGSKDEPVGSGILNYPNLASDKQKETLIEALGLSRESKAIPPGSYSAATLPPLSYPAFVILMRIYDRSDRKQGRPAGYGFTRLVKSNLDRLARRFPEFPKPQGERMNRMIFALP